MNELVNAVVRLFDQGFSAIGQFLRFIGRWTYGEIAGLFRISFWTLPLWKQILYVIAVLAIIYFCFRLITALVYSAQRIARTIGELLITIIEEIPDVVAAGIIALVIAWIIHNVNSPYLNSLHF